MRHPNRNGKRRQRQEAAAARQAEYDQLSLPAKVARAFERGAAARGDGAISMDRRPTREFARLSKEMDR